MAQYKMAAHRQVSKRKNDFCQKSHSQEWLKMDGYTKKMSI